jgi:hypothetical protein
VDDNIGMIRLRQAFQQRLLLHNGTNSLIFFVSVGKMMVSSHCAWLLPLPEQQAAMVDSSVRTGSAGRNADWICRQKCGLDLQAEMRIGSVVEGTS